MKIWHISDTHSQENKLIIPDVDMVIHAGDESNHSDPIKNLPEAIKFFDWFEKLDIKHKIYVPGNHSTAVANNLVVLSDYKFTSLIHQECIIEDIRIFGSPYTPSFSNSWVFMKKRNRMEEVWKNVPNCDILITHGPPKGILDLTTDPLDRDRLIQVGCKSLYNKVMEIKPKIHIYGHIHQEPGLYNRGIYEGDHTTFINAACLNHRENIFYQGFIREY